MVCKGSFHISFFILSSPTRGCSFHYWWKQHPLDILTYSTLVYRYYILTLFSYSSGLFGKPLLLVRTSYIMTQFIGNNTYLILMIYLILILFDPVIYQLYYPHFWQYRFNYNEDFYLNQNLLHGNNKFIEVSNVNEFKVKLLH